MSYVERFRSICRNDLHDAAPSGGGYAPHRDPDYAEKRELISKLDEMRSLGFNIPPLDYRMPIEDLQSELSRRTVSMGTVATVDTAISYICAGASILEQLNNQAGPFLPMEGYAKSVEKGTATPRFKYALYQLVLRHQGRSGSSPYTIVAMVLLMPLLEAFIIKAIQWLAKGRISGSAIKFGVKGAMGMIPQPGANKPVPSGIPGVSADMSAPADEPPMANMSTFKPPPKPTRPPPPERPRGNPFARFPKMTSQKMSKPQDKPAPSETKRLPRLPLPSEIPSTPRVPTEDAPSGVITEDQMTSGRVRI